MAMQDKQRRNVAPHRPQVRIAKRPNPLEIQKSHVFFHNVRHPAEMGEPEINAFLTHLAVEEKVSASTQNQALSALLFLYRHVLAAKWAIWARLSAPASPRACLWS
jgi:site-specific recombinase XerD